MGSMIGFANIDNIPFGGDSINSTYSLDHSNNLERWTNSTFNGQYPTMREIVKSHRGRPLNNVMKRRKKAG